MSSALRRYALALALLATLVGTFAPSITHLLGARGAVLGLGGICSAANSHSSDAPPSPMDGHSDCCQFCASHGFIFSPPSAEFVWQGASFAPAYLVVRTRPAPPASRQWQPAQPRGPPSLV